MKRIANVLLFVLFVGSGMLQAQVTITGTVTGAPDGSPLPGVSVIVQGTFLGTSTNIDGQYTLQIPEDALVLEFSYIGYQDMVITIDEQRVISPVMQPEAIGLDEVVVVAYGTANRGEIAGSATSVTADEIKNVPVTSIDKSLQGKSTGLLTSSTSGQPGSKNSVIIRGIGSINASTEPLYIVDGIPVATGNLDQRQYNTNALSTINPADIASFTILKDAAATSLYGAKAANGVILITTKKGMEGKTIYNFNSQVGWSNRVTENFRVLNKAEYRELMYEQKINAGISPGDAYAKVMALGDGNTNWVDEAFKTGFMHQYDLSARGGSELINFFASGSYLNQEGIVIGSDFERMSGRLNLSFQASERVKVGFNNYTSFARQNGTSGSGTYSDPVTSAFFIPPVETVYNQDGTFNDDIPVNLDFNLVQSVDEDEHKNEITKYMNNGFVEVDILDGLQYKFNSGIDYYHIKGFEYWNQNNPNGETYKGFAEESQLRKTTWIATNTLNYKKSLMEAHNLDVLMGQEAQKTLEVSSVISNSEFPNDKMRTLASGAKPLDAFTYEEGATLASFFGRINYNYNNKYFLVTSFRCDGSSRFGADNKWANFGSVGGIWHASKEPFLTGVRQISELRIRASIGTTGNSDILVGYDGDQMDEQDFYAARGLYTYGQDYNGKPGSGLSQLENSKLKWETNRTYNLGIDFGITNRVFGTFEYYNKLTKDLLLRVPISSTTGQSNILDNVGSMLNRGVELELTTKNIIGEFNWSTTLNFTRNINDILTLNNGEDITTGMAGDDRQIRRESFDFSTFYLVRWAGVNPSDGTALWYDKDGNPVSDYNDADKVVTDKKASPDFFGGITNKLTYKGLELSVFLYGMYGNSIYNNSDRYLSSDGGGEANVDARQLNRWTTPGQITSVPKRIDGASWSNKNSTRHLEDGSYLKIKNLTIAYNLPTNVIEQLRLTNARFYIQSDNTYTWTNFSGWDPETTLRGTSWFAYPNAKTFVIGIDLTF